MPIWLCIVIGIVGGACAFGPILGFADESLGTTYIGDWDEESIKRHRKESLAPLPVRIVVYVLYALLIGAACTVLVVFVPH